MKKLIVKRPVRELTLLDGIAQTSEHLLLLARLIEERDRITHGDNDLSCDLLDLVYSNISCEVDYLRSLSDN